MKAVNPNSKGRNRVVWHFKIAGAAIALALQLQSYAAAPLSTPKGLDMFSILPVQPLKAVQIQWNFPILLETPDMIFKLYHSHDLTLPFHQWKVLTNIPGAARGVLVPMTLP